MDLLVLLLCCYVSSVVTLFVIRRKTAYGEMDVEWNSEKQVWNASIHIPQNINYHKRRKLVLMITTKK